MKKRGSELLQSSKTNVPGEKTPGDTPVMLILAYFESFLEVESMMWSTITSPSRRAPDNLNDAELSSNKGLLMYQSACIARVYVHADKHYLFHWPLTFKQGRFGPRRSL